MTHPAFDFDASAIAQLHDRYNQHADWPNVVDLKPTAPSPWAPDFLAAVLDNHRCNARLWCEEDLARRQRAPDAEIVANKRAIDAFNQSRNNAIERMDEYLLLTLGLVDPESVTQPQARSQAPAGARLNSETVGSMIDRVSILSLKIKAMAEQTRRTDVDDGHRSDAAAKLARLNEQRQDLCDCMRQLIAECQTGTAYFKVYRQFKMYNDPNYNLALVKERAEVPR